MYRLAQLIVSILLLSCQQTGLKENVSKNQPIEVTSFHHSSFQNKKIYDTPVTGTSTGDNDVMDWMGIWHFEQDKVKYSITIDEKHKDASRCVYQVKGIPAYYVLACKGVLKGNVFELYYRYTDDGNFFRETKIDRYKPILTLSLVNGKVITYWNQLPGGRNGQECFKKKA